MKVEMLIVSYSKDMEWLRFNLRTIEKFADGFSGITVLVPNHERSLFSWVEPQCRLLSYAVPDDSKYHHLAHQIAKCRADEWCPDADLIFFTDSDCFFIEPVIPEDYLKDGKPVLCIESFNRLPGNPWKAPTDAALGINSKWETMRRHGAIHWRNMFPEFRSRVEKVTGKPFHDYVLSCKPDYPWFFSEFVALGNFVLTSHWVSQYHFIDLGKQPWPRNKMLDVWSHAPIDQAQPERYRGLFPPHMTVKQILEKVLA